MHYYIVFVLMCSEICVSIQSVMQIRAKLSK